MTFVLLAFAAGALTVLAPCILPLLPIILGGTQGASSSRPLWVVAGFVLSFSVVGALLATAGTFIGLTPSTLRTLAVVVLIILGLLLVFPKLYEVLQVPFERALASRGQALASRGGRGTLGGVVVGIAMGIIWTPCAGPVLGSILTLAATQRDALATAALLVAYSLGAAVPMLAVAYLGRRFTDWLKQKGHAVGVLNRVFGTLLILTALAIATGFDRELQALLLPFLPGFVVL